MICEWFNCWILVAGLVIVCGLLFLFCLNVIFVTWCLGLCVLTDVCCYCVELDCCFRVSLFGC